MTTEEITTIRKFLEAADKMERHANDGDPYVNLSDRDNYFHHRSAIIGIIMKWGAMDKVED